METLKLWIPLIEDWCKEVGTDHFVLTVVPDRITIAALTPKGVVSHVFRTDTIEQDRH